MNSVKSFVDNGHSSYGHWRYSEKLQFSNQTWNIDYRKDYPANLNCTTLAVVDTTIKDKIPKEYSHIILTSCFYSIRLKKAHKDLNRI